MAINLCCPVCYKAYKLGTIACKCGNNLKRHKLFKVRIKLSNGKWKSKQVNSLELAKKVEAKFKTESIEQDVFNINKAPIIGIVWEKYIQWAKLNKRSWIDDKIRWKLHISPYLIDTRMNRISPSHIQNILNDMSIKKKPKGAHYAPATIKQVLSLIKRVFNWAIRRDLYTGLNPCLKVKAPKFDNRVNNTLSKEDLKNLLSVLDSWENQRGALVVKFALFTGKRRGEILSLRWEDIDLDNRLMTFHGFNTKSGKSQTLPVGQKAYEALLMAKALKVCNHVFSSKNGQYSPDGFNSIWRRIRNKAGLTIRFHDLRHTYASYLASSGKVDIYTLKELLGHSTIEMTQRYAHLVNGALKRAVDVADEVL